jgi:CheY-like chemotaxis protein
MRTGTLNLLLADDDRDDCIFFKEALEEIPVKTKLVTVHDGVQLMAHLLKKETVLPYVLYLDLNMPLKNGFDALREIRSTEKLKGLPVIMFSTSFNQETAEQLQQQGATYFIQKPPEFGNLKKVIHRSLNLIMENHGRQDTAADFLLNPE